MPREVITLDFETKEPHDLIKYGSGWPIGTTKLVCAAIQDVNNRSDLQCYDNLNQILDIVNEAKVIINHNAQYDSGLLTMWGVDLRDKLIVDTKNLAFFRSNLERAYSLDYLASKYTNKKKGQDELGMAVVKHNLWHTSTGKNQKAALFSTATSYAYSNLDILYKIVPEVVRKYCMMDVDITTDLYLQNKQYISDEWLETLSDVNKQYILMKKRGVDYDISNLNEIKANLLSLLYDTQEEIWDILGIKYGKVEWLTQKPKLVEYLTKLKIKFPYTPPSDRFPNGQPSITSDWLEDQPHDFCQALKKFNGYNSYISKYVNGMLEYRDVFHPGKQDIITVYPDYMIMSAVTGRGSCNHPNMKNFPSFNKKKVDLNVVDDNSLSYRLRHCIVSTNGFVLENDYKQQEPRIFADCCNKLGMPELTDLLNKNPETDFHQMVADNVTKMDRDVTKAIYLGIIYGKGNASLAYEMGITEAQAKEVKKKLLDMFPALDRYRKSLTHVGKTRGHINLDGRRVYARRPMQVVDKETGEKKMRDYYYQLSNWYCQGRGANQIMKVMSALYKKGITPYYEVYDALGFEVNSLEGEDLQKIHDIKRIMETDNTFECSVPMLVDTGVGKSWAEAKSKQGEERGKELYVKETQ